MRKLIFILCLVLASCSTEEVITPEEVEDLSYGTIVLQNVCPDPTAYSEYDVDKANLEKVQQAVDKMDNRCLEVEFTDLKNNTVKGWWAASFWNKE